MIRAHEAYNDIDSIRTILNGKRDIAFIVITADKYIDNTESINAIQLAIKNGLNLIAIKSRKDGIAFVVYKDNKNKALQLANIAESYNGYLKNETPEISEMIGNLLEYHPNDVKNFIKESYYKNFV